MIVTGEASGDLHGAKLIKATRDMCGEVDFFGVGGPRMSAEGCDVLIPGEELAVMGLVEVLGHFPVIWKAFQRLKRILQSDQRPDALVLIDFPEFNLRLARQAQRAGVPVLYYVSPQVWAWRRGRVKKIARVVNRLAAIFPFEPDLYQGEDIQVEYVGHPLLDEVDSTLERTDLLESLKITSGARVVGLFPGSRQTELKSMLETLVAAAQLIHKRRPDIRFLVPIAAGLPLEEVRRHFPKELPIDFISSEEMSIYAIARACDAILTVSGTVTLQVALTGTPMAIFYKLSPLSYAIGKRLVRVDHIGLANIVAGKGVVREFIQNDATPENLADEALKLVEDEEYASEIRDGLASIQDRLGQPGCSERVARMLLEMTAKMSEKIDDQK